MSSPLSSQKWKRCTPSAKLTCANSRNRLRKISLSLQQLPSVRLSENSFSFILFGKLSLKTLMISKQFMSNLLFKKNIFGGSSCLLFRGYPQVSRFDLQTGSGQRAAGYRRPLNNIILLVHCSVQMVHYSNALYLFFFFFFTCGPTWTQR